MKILLAIDGSSYSDAAVAEVCRRPWPPQSEVRLLTVDTPRDGSPLQGRSSDLFEEIIQRQRMEVLQRLSTAVAYFKHHAPELSVTPILREGWPKEVILEDAEQWGADLIVVGSQGRGAIRRLFLGSVSLAIATNALCSVEIVRMPPAPADATPAIEE